ncbi:MAG TPA: 50S ribosomal protein L21 [Saprospiraceae bacterium]|nr:50S ribosomal protein L21 [Saprospiraceae bacterium]MCC6689484.1 50S ribosomal protein L21 [Saprospiraceae bacterium]HMV23417.1 50S ribosomal protein L21 [Saprospiraceae bacterium]HMW75847.1 50S ribosomal protein L21 [Saprospiraceae bacterium]HMX85543.1 50S ribosomal protein L21 [Saprospiraceae bacterium]
MFVVVSIAGQQFKVSEGNTVFVHQLDAKEGDKVSFDQVLLVSSGSDVTLGKPSVAGAKVNATVLKHAKGDKVIVFKKKRRKGYRVKNGHRQCFTQIKIDSITR